uniref:FkbM family methyltransferase n=1 Tax=Gelidibacter sp. TaxID=2018083 RepID=UPI00404B26B6
MNYKYNKSFSYRLAGKLAKILNDYQSRLINKSHKDSEKKWLELFNGKDSFIFKLDEGVNINLYRDSSLSNLIYRGFEKRERKYIKSILNEDDIFVDVGSNIGLFSLIASKYVGHKGSVICFEPDPISFKRLEENIEMNKLHNLDARNLGLSNDIGELEFHIYDDGKDAWNSFAKDEELSLSNSISVPVSTLDRELENIDKSRIKVVKIDVEGWEKFVLLGGQNFFKEFSPVVLMEFTDVNAFNAGYGIHELFDIMSNWGYVWYRLEKNNILKKEIKQFRYPFVNLIAVKSVN